MRSKRPARRKAFMVTGVLSTIAVVVAVAWGVVFSTQGAVSIDVPDQMASMEGSDAMDAKDAGAQNNAESPIDPDGNALNTSEGNSPSYTASADDAAPSTVAGEVLVHLDAASGEDMLAPGMALGESVIKDVEVVSEDADGGKVVKVILDEGSSTDEAIDELNTMEGASAQHNFIYRLMEMPTEVDAVISEYTDDVSTEADAVAPDHRTNDPASSGNLLYHLWPYQAGSLSGANVEAAWDLNRSDGSVTIAVIDTGCTPDHPDLKGNIDTEHMIDVYNNADRPGTISDLHGHGTHVAGIIAAVADNEIGGAGTSYNAKVLPIKVFPNDGSGTTSTDRMVRAYDYLDTLLDSGELTDLHVINMSLGTYGLGETDRELEKRINHMAEVHNVLTVCAGGNGDSKTNKPYTKNSYPSDFAACLSVTCLTTKGDDTAWSDYNECKDISAPGMVIYSTYNTGGYTQLSGTSMASPLVAGVAGLLFASVPDLTPEQAIQFIKGTAQEMPSSTNHDLRVNDPEHKTGSAGAIDAAAALKKALLDTGTVKYFIEEADVSVPATMAYTGQPLEPAVTVTHNGQTLIEDHDYTLIYKKNVKPGTGTVVVRGCGDYGGYIDKEFTITIAEDQQIDINVATVGEIGPFTYTGSPITPAVTVTQEGQELVLDEDYTVSYEDNTNAGQAKVIVAGKGLYKNRKEVPFTIDKARGWLHLDERSVTLVGSGSPYEAHIFCSPDLTFSTETDDECVATVEVVKEHQNVTHSTTCTFVITPHEAGTTTVTLDATTTPNYTAVDPVKIKVTVNDEKKDLSHATVSVEGHFVYDGKAQKPAPTVVLNGKVLQVETNYTLQYSQCIQAGQAFVTAIGKGEYSGRATGRYTIEPALPNLTFEPVALELQPNSSGEVRVSYDDVGFLTGVESTDTRVARPTYDPYSKVLTVTSGEAGAAVITFTVEGSANYQKRSATLPVSVGGQTQAVESVTLNKEHIELSVGQTATLIATINPANATDQTVRWSSTADNIASVDQRGYVTAKAPGEAHIKAEVGGKSAECEVVVAELPVSNDIAFATVSGVDESYVYSGNEIAPEPIVVLNGKTLKSGEDYELSYEDNTDAGTACIVIKGKGAYTGQARIMFTITRKTAHLTLTGQSFTLNENGTATTQVAYDGDGEVSVRSDASDIADAIYDGEGLITITAHGEGTTTITVLSAGEKNYTTPMPLTINVKVVGAVNPPTPGGGQAGGGTGGTPGGGGVPSEPSDAPSIAIDDGHGSNDIKGGSVDVKTEPAARAGRSLVSAALVADSAQKPDSVTVLVNGQPVGYLVDEKGHLVFEVGNDDNVVIVPAFKAATASPGTFEDVDPHQWYEHDVYQAYNLGYMGGYGTGKPGEAPHAFGPEDTLTRSQAAVVLFNLTGANYMLSGRYNAKLLNWPDTFSDVENDISNVYRNAIVWGHACNLITGYGGSSNFGGEDSLTREQVCALLARYAALEETPGDFVMPDEDTIQAELAKYPDADTISAWARPSVAWASKHGIIGQGGFLNGQNDILRCEMAAMMCRYQPKATNLVLYPTA